MGVAQQQKEQKPKKQIRNEPKQIPVDIAKNPDWLKKKDDVPIKLHSMKKVIDCKDKRKVSSKKRHLTSGSDGQPVFDIEELKRTRRQMFEQIRNGQSFEKVLENNPILNAGEVMKAYMD